MPSEYLPGIRSGFDCIVGREENEARVYVWHAPSNGQRWATVRPIGTKKSPGLGVVGFLRRTEGTGAGGLEGPSVHRINAHRADTVPTRHRCRRPVRMLAESAVKCNLIAEMAGILPK